MSRVRWQLTRDDEVVGSGVRFRANEDAEAIVARARRDAAAQAHAGDRLTVFIDGELYREERFDELDARVLGEAV